MENVVKLELSKINDECNQNAIDVLLSVYDLYPLYYEDEGQLINIWDSEELVNLYDDFNTHSFYVKLDPFIKVS